MKKSGKKSRVIIFVGGMIIVLLLAMHVFEGRWERRREGSCRSGLINILLLGVDKTEKMDERSRSSNSIGQSDGIYVISLDMEKNEIRVLSIPRDTMVTLEMYNSEGVYLGQREGQLTLQYAYGDGVEKSCELMQDQVEKLLQIPIDGYVAFNFTALRTLNNLLYGVPVYMDQDYTWILPEFRQGETVRMTDNQAMAFCEYRDKMEDGSAFTRMERLKTYMRSFFIEGKEAVKKNPFWLAKAWTSVQEDIVTDLEVLDLLDLVRRGMSCSLSDENVYVIAGTLNSDGEYEEFYAEEEAVRELVAQLFY